MCYGFLNFSDESSFNPDSLIMKSSRLQCIYYGKGVGCRGLTTRLEMEKRGKLGKQLLEDVRK